MDVIIISARCYYLEMSLQITFVSFSLLTLCFRMAYPYRYELYKRVDEPSGKEKYIILSTFPQNPNSDEVNDAFLGKTR